MITKEQFDIYFEQVQHLASLASTDIAMKHLLLQIIEDEQISSSDNPSFEEFLKGELAFYSKQYTPALKHYLQAKSVPYHKLFCYRASAYLAKESGDFLKAQGFAEKALEIYQKDYPSQALLTELTSPASISMKEVSMYSQPDPLVAKENEIAPVNLVERLYTQPQDTPFVKAPVSASFSMPQTLLKRPYRSANAPSSEVLTQSIASFHKKHKALKEDYLNLLGTRTSPNDNALYVLQGNDQSDQLIPHLLTHEAYRTTGGFYIRWNGKGVVINPGKRFLEHFHRQGLHIRDIHYVVVTGEEPSTYSDIEEIYSLNYQLNQGNSSQQVIHYYLSQKSYEVLARKLKPVFKQERNMLHCLELFRDSPDIEKVVLNEEITLSYFPASIQMDRLGIRLDLGGDLSTKTVGYTSGAPWSAMLAEHLKQCDLVVAGFGHTALDDYTKRSYNSDCLGYFGSYSLMEHVQPRLFVCSDFDGSEGDIRLEVVKLLRQQYLEAHPEADQAPVVLPGDSKLVINLSTLEVKCSVTSLTVDPMQVSVVKTHEGGGRLQYLSPHCYT